MLSRIELKAFCVSGRRDNRYTTALELHEVASFSCFADLEFFVISAFVETYGKFCMS